MQKMKFYIISGYAAFSLVAFSLLFIFMIALLSFNPLNDLPTALGEKLIIAANQFSENSRLIIIFFVTSSLLLITLVGAYLMRSLYRSLQMLTYTMNKIAYTENGLTYYMQTTSYPEINEIASNLNHAQNKLKEKIFLTAQETKEINKYLESKVDELNNIKKFAESARQSKSEFLSIMSHELRTPLNAIIGYSEILQEDAEESGYTKYCAYFDNIINSAKNLLALINATFEENKSTHVNLFKLTFGSKHL